MLPADPYFSLHFETAADAVVNGDLQQLRNLLADDPALITARSDRDHRATLLHYVGANGVEEERQRTPPNAMVIAEELLGNGADVDAVALMYGGATTLALVATSVHPCKAGLQLPLIDLLMQHGADPAKANGVKGSDNGEGLINACLANGRGEAAAHLARKGVPYDLEGAGGIGDLERIKSHLREDGSLADESLRTKLDAAFGWACEYGHANVVTWLADQNYPLGTLSNGMTGLHWAVVGRQLAIVQLLLERNAPMNIRNRYGGTVPEQAEWMVMNEPGEASDGILQLLLRAEG